MARVHDNTQWRNIPQGSRPSRTTRLETGIINA
jgi:hypothetical protein